MYAVIGRNHALDELADAMVVADLPTQELIERMVLALNARLTVDALKEGESRWWNFRVTFQEPVALLIDISIADGVVHVVHFWTY